MPHLRVIDQWRYPRPLLPDGLELYVVSDMHLHPRSWPNVDDDPDSLLDLICSIPRSAHLVFLGDTTEGYLTLGATWFESEFQSASRLAPLLAELRGRPNLHVILGNHDAWSRGALHAVFGSRMVEGPRVIGRVVLLHGHELSGYFSGIASEVSQMMIPVLMIASRFVRRMTGMNVETVVPEGDMDGHVDRYRRRLRCDLAVYGHTHAPHFSGDRRVVNTGSFLRRPHRKTLVHVLPYTVSLLEYVRRTQPGGTDMTDEPNAARTNEAEKDPGSGAGERASVTEKEVPAVARERRTKPADPDIGVRVVRMVLIAATTTLLAFVAVYAFLVLKVESSGERIAAVVMTAAIILTLIVVIYNIARLWFVSRTDAGGEATTGDIVGQTLSGALSAPRELLSTTEKLMGDSPVVRQVLREGLRLRGTPEKDIDRLTQELQRNGSEKDRAPPPPNVPSA
jgi:predicted phosphodiesterase